tara:strand:- start:30 stop:542 length:513 start_codon:yes stop_codon:yes gene_type:complete
MNLASISKVYRKTLFLMIVSFYNFAYTQPVLPQRTITLNPSQALSFGTFCDNSGVGGTISIDWQGIRTTTGGIVALPSSPGLPAIFDVKLCQGRNIKITYPQTSTLTNSAGQSLILDIGPTEKGGNGAIFSTEKNCNFITILRVGATLHIPPNTIIGKYKGSFTVSFDQQ